MLKQHTSIKNLYDLYAIRIVVDTVRECYTALGIMHTRFKPIPGRFKDYIAMPKQNMYQSIHTVVIGTGGRPVEVQIRTKEMHRVSEFGIAAHWRYKEGKTKEDTFEKKMSWLRELIEWQGDVDNKDYYENLKIDLFTDEIFVFTPKGDVYELPTLATPIDFAYRVHTEIGHRCIGAKVNGSMVGLDASLQNGDIVEIMTSNQLMPRFSWLSFVKTSSARNKIKQWLKKHTDIYDDVDIPEEKPVAKKQEHKPLITEQTMNEAPPKPRRKSAGIIVQQDDDVLTYLSRCCNPLPGDAIVGYITRGRGIAVHKVDCRNVHQFDNDRLVKVSWDQEYKGAFDLALEIEAYDRVGLLNDVVGKITELKINIVNGSVKTNPKGVAVVNLILSLADVELLDSIVVKLKSVKDVYDVRRI